MNDFVRSNLGFGAVDGGMVLPVGGIPAAGENGPAMPVPVLSRPVIDSRAGWYGTWGKRGLDIVLTLLTLPLTLPVIGLCALLLWAEGGQPFYRQDRLGAAGRRFSILKLRTMTRDADARLAEYLAKDPGMALEWRTTQKLKRDPRITRVGRWLRVTSLDELPQLWNVLRGEMSLIGPRPMMPDQLPLYGDPQAYFALRPGISGFWQVSARNESHFAFRHETDADYFGQVSLATDVRVIFKTLGVVLRPTGY